MAQTAEHHTEFCLDDYLRLVRLTVRCGIYPALRAMERHIVGGQLRLMRRDADGKGDAVEIDRRDFLSNYTLEFDSDDRVRVAAQRPQLLPDGIFFTTGFDPSNPESSFWRSGRAVDGYYTIIEHYYWQRPDPVEAKESKVSHVNRARQSRVASATPAKRVGKDGKLDGWQARRVKQALEKLFPPDGHTPPGLSQKTILDRVNKFLEQQPASLDTLARVTGRRHT